MLSYWKKILKCWVLKKNTERISSKVKIWKMMLSPKCTVYDRKNLKFIKQSEAKGLLSKLTGFRVTNCFKSKKSMQ